MIYVTSDLHGCSRERFRLLLEKAGFREEDELYILGDVIDRNGDGGIDLLLWITEQPNVRMLLGNHEAMMLSCGFLFEKITDESLNGLNTEQMMLYMNWLRNGAKCTMSSLKKLREEDRERFEALWDYLLETPLYEILKIGDRVFLMTHSGFENFSPDKEPDEYTDDELLWNRPKLTDRYFDNVTVIMGHTPTKYLDPDSAGRMIRTDTWLDIDVGGAEGKPPMLLRLDDMKEFYFTEDELNGQ